MSIPRNDDHDDGLVHSHNWASSEQKGPVLVNRPRTAPVATPMRAADLEPDFDDGLVHGHNWASSERGREAH